MTEQEIIQRWKENDRYFASPNITDEMREWARKNWKDMQGLNVDAVFTNKTIKDYLDYHTYRLRPNFELPKEPEKANLGLATTRELLDELKTRIDVHWDLNYRTVDGDKIRKDEK
jgi:hypothetical protein